MLLFIQFALAAILVPLSYLLPRVGNRYFRALELSLSRFAARRWLAVLTIFFLALSIRLAVLPIEPIPAPGVHDEFGYLLAADTFAHGRLTNPTHPMWMHFESMTIIQRPTYCSAFYPAQGAFLAMGQVVFGHPFWGVWLSTAFMCAAICWALQAWMPPAWAFLGGLLAIIQIGTFTYWTDSYWGGSVAAFGGALALGSLPRIKSKMRTRDAILMGIGLAILANSRPYEGLFYSTPILVSLAIFLFKQKSSFAISIRRVLTPLTFVIVLTFGFMGYYFWRTTGNPFRPPYLVDVATYMQEPQFLWGKIKSVPHYDHVVMADFYGNNHMQSFLEARRDLVSVTVRKFFYFWLFFVGPILTVPFFVLSSILPYGMKLRDFGNKMRFLIILCGVSFFAMLLPPFFNAHYAAPMTCATYAVILFAMRRVRIWDRCGRKKGLFIIRGTVLFTCLVYLAIGTVLACGVPHLQVLPSDPYRVNIARTEIIRGLSSQRGKSLIVVRYSSDHKPDNEWVYNNADIDNSKVVWAREMGFAEDQKLLEYFGDRRVLLLEADISPPLLIPYSTENANPAPAILNK